MSNTTFNVHNYTKEQEIDWLRRCLPIFIQPEIDLLVKNDLVNVFYTFHQEPKTLELNCKLSIVFAGESSFNRKNEQEENLFATFMYRTFNRRTYKRTADINYIEYRNISLDPQSNIPWQSIYTFDHSGNQKWSQGNKKNIGTWFSLMHHYEKNIMYQDWEIEINTNRPRLYLNTCNHMIGEYDNNPSLLKHEWKDYPFIYGNAKNAFEYVVHHIPTKNNLYSYAFFWKARNGGGTFDRHTTGKIIEGEGSVYIVEKKLEKSNTSLTAVSSFDESITTSIINDAQIDNMTTSIVEDVKVIQ